jgi:hypothetical protein
MPFERNNDQTYDGWANTDVVVFTGGEASARAVKAFLGKRFKFWDNESDKLVMRIGPSLEATITPGDTLRRNSDGTFSIFKPSEGEAPAEAAGEDSGED